MISGSIVNIFVTRDIAEEERQLKEFWDIQDYVLNTYGTQSPEIPVVRVRNITQTSLVLEWDPLVLHTAELRSLDIYKGDVLLQYRAPAYLNFMKISGLEVDHEYSFHIIMKTSAGKFPSNKVVVRTHSLDNLTGIQVAFGELESPDTLFDELKALVEKIGAKWSSETTKDTTHVITQTPVGRNNELAMELSIPVVKPEWLIQSAKSGRIQVIFMGLFPL